MNIHVLFFILIIVETKLHHIFFYSLYCLTNNISIFIQFIMYQMILKNPCSWALGYNILDLCFYYVSDDLILL